MRRSLYTGYIKFKFTLYSRTYVEFNCIRMFCLFLFKFFLSQNSTFGIQSSTNVCKFLNKQYVLVVTFCSCNVMSLQKGSFFRQTIFTPGKNEFFHLRLFHDSSETFNCKHFEIVDYAIYLKNVIIVFHRCLLDKHFLHCKMFC